MFEKYSDVISVTELSQMLDIGIILAYKLIKENKIKSRKIGREYKILKSDVIIFLQTSAEKP